MHAAIRRLAVSSLLSASFLCGAQVRKATAPSAGTLGYLRTKAGAGPWTLWKTEPLHRRLLALLGPQEFEALQLNMDPAEPVAINNGILTSVGIQAHMGTEEEGAIIIDLNRDIAEVLILHDGKTVRAWAERNQFVPPPSDVYDRIKLWPQPMLRQALAGLEKASSTSAGITAQNAPQHNSGSVLDDINAVFDGGSGQAPASSAAASRAGSSAAVPHAASARNLPEAMGQQFEVSGLRIGMPAAQAAGVAARLVPKGTPRITQFSLTELPGFVMTSGANYFDGNSREHQSITLGYTLSPKQAMVWGIERRVEYDEDALPSISATIAALRTKYGPESAYGENSIVHERTLIWLRDANGNPVPKNQAGIVADACAHLGLATQSTQTDITNGWDSTVPNQMDCSPYTFLNATLIEWESTRHDSHGRFKPAGLLLSLQEDVMSYPLRRANYETTIAVAEAARRKRESDEVNKARNKSAPL